MPNASETDDYADNWSGWYPSEPDISLVTNELPAEEPHLQNAVAHVPAQTALNSHNEKMDLIMLPQTFKCAKCKESYDESHLLLKHIREVHRSSTVKAKKTSSSKGDDAVKQKKKRGERQRLECDICQRPFNDSYKLKVHRRTHTREKPFKCDTCDKSFIDSCNLKEHQKVHTGEKLFECDICQKTFLQLGTLTTHRRTHTGEKPYTCDVCHMTFALLSSMKTHKRRAHTGEKPHKCDFCQKAFVKRNDMVRHRRTHTGERPFVCDICRQSFTQSYVLVLHKRNHHSGDGTGRAAPTTNKRHDAPPRDRPFKCGACHKSFASQSTLNIHNRTHTGEKPFHCDECGKSFTQSSGLVAHRAAHHVSIKPPFGQADALGTGGSRPQYVAAPDAHRIPQYAGDRPCQCAVCQSSFGQPVPAVNDELFDHPVAVAAAMSDSSIYYG